MILHLKYLIIEIVKRERLTQFFIIKEFNYCYSSILQYCTRLGLALKR